MYILLKNDFKIQFRMFIYTKEFFNKSICYEKAD
jgi:hypothetical protein